MNQIVNETYVTKKLQVSEQCSQIVTRMVEIRKEIGFSQEFVADMIGCSRKKLSEFENGKFDFDLLVKYCDKLDIEIDIKIK